MNEIKKCENCGNENIEIINRFKGHYSCGKCGRDTERLYEIEHDKEIRAKAIDEFAEELRGNASYIRLFGHEQGNYVVTTECIDRIVEQMKGGAT